MSKSNDNSSPPVATNSMIALTASNSRSCSISLTNVQVPNDSVDSDVASNSSAISSLLDPQSSAIADPAVLSHHINSASSLQQIRILANKWRRTYDTNKIGASNAFLELIFNSIGIDSNLMSRIQLQHLESVNVEELDEYLRCENIQPLVEQEEYCKNFAKFMRFAFDREVLTERRMNLVHAVLTNFTSSKWRVAWLTAILVSGVIIDKSATLSEDLEKEIEDSNNPEEILILKKCYITSLKVVDTYVSLIHICMRLSDFELRSHACSLYCSWCQFHPKIFQKNKFLCHIHWALYDDNSKMRADVIKKSTALIISSRHPDRLQSFTDRTLKALVLRSHDKVQVVAIEAINAIIAIHRKCPDAFGTISLNKLYLVIFGDRPAVADRAGAFLYLMLADVHSQPVTFLSIVVDFLHESEIRQKGRRCDYFLARVMLNHAAQLRDWSAWVALLTRPHQPHVSKACALLAQVVSYVFTGERRSIPSGMLDDEETQPENVSYRTKNQEFFSQVVREKSQKQLTKYFQPVVQHLWKKFKGDGKCLGALISVARYFTFNDDMDLKGLCIQLINLDISDWDTVSDKVATLASFYKYMLSSKKWREDIPQMEKSLFGNVEPYLKSVQRLSNCPMDKNNKAEIALDQVLLKKALVLASHFDLTETKFMDIAFASLYCGENNRDLKKHQALPEILTMCQILLNWQVKNLLSGKYTEDVEKVVLERMYSQLSTLNKWLKEMIQNEDIFIRGWAFLITCWIQVRFQEKNKIVQNYPLLHLPPLDLIVTEWLNYHVLTKVPQQGVPKGKEFNHARSVLSNFCTLLCIGKLHSSYFSTLLPYFQFYTEDENYNDVLDKTVRLCMTRDTFQTSVVDGLALLRKQFQPVEAVPTMAEGLCAALNKLNPEHKVVDKIVDFGLVLVCRTADFQYLPILKTFLKLISRKRKCLTFKWFHFYFNSRLEDPFIKDFLTALKE